MKVCKSENPDGTLHGYLFECPGCDHAHVFDTRWTFVNGDVDRPTFIPSLLCRSRYGKEEADRVCHSYVTNGQIQFLPDCTHKLAGQTVDLPDWV